MPVIIDGTTGITTPSYALQANSMVSVGNSTVNTTITNDSLSVGTSFYSVANGNVSVGNSTPNSIFVIVGSTGSTNDKALVDIQASGNSTYARGMRMLNGGMSNGAGLMYSVGYDDSARNMGQFTFHYNSANSANNRASIGLHSVDDLMSFWGSNVVSISNNTPSTNYKLTVQGNTYVSGVLYSSLAGMQDHETVRLYDGQLASTNLNDLYDERSGVYYSGTQYTTNSNIPHTNYFTLLNLRNPGGGSLSSAANTNDRVAQLWIGDTVGRAYLRVRQGPSGWYGWENILTSGVPGTVVQIAYNTNNSASGSITGTTATSTGISVSITPKSANNLILVIGHLHVFKSTATPHFNAFIYRNSTAIITGLGTGGSDNDSGLAHYDAPGIVVDAPNTTSSVTYTWYAATREAGGTININDGGSYRSSIVAIEFTGVQPGRA